MKNQAECAVQTAGGATSECRGTTDGIAITRGVPHHLPVGGRHKNFDEVTMEGRSLVISFLNRKGGVGKTSSVFHLAGHFAQGGLKVLVCDLDPQASLSQGFFGPAYVESLPKKHTVAALFDDAYDPQIEDIVHNTPFENLWIIPATNDLTDHNTPRPEEAKSQYALRDVLSEARNQAQVTLVDCPPNLQLCSWAALLGSDFVIVPVIPEDFSSQGLIYVQQAIDAAMTKGNPRLRLLGYMLTMYNRQLGIHKAYEKLLREQYGELVFETVFPLATAYKEAVSRRHPITLDKPKSASADAVKALTDEIMLRAPIFGSRKAEFYYAGNRYVPGVSGPQDPIIGTQSEEAA
jgi:chromosome partitioning protein